MYSCCSIALTLAASCCNCCVAWNSVSMVPCNSISKRLIELVSLAKAWLVTRANAVRSLCNTTSSEAMVLTIFLSLSTFFFKLWSLYALYIWKPRSKMMLALAATAPADCRGWPAEVPWPGISPWCRSNTLVQVWFWHDIRKANCECCSCCLEAVGHQPILHPTDHTSFRWTIWPVVDPILWPWQSVFCATPWSIDQWRCLWLLWLELSNFEPERSNHGVVQTSSFHAVSAAEFRPWLVEFPKEPTNFLCPNELKILTTKPQQNLFPPSWSCQHRGNAPLGTWFSKGTKSFLPQAPPRLFPQDQLLPPPRPVLSALLAQTADLVPQSGSATLFPEPKALSNFCDQIQVVPQPWECPAEILASTPWSLPPPFSCGKPDSMFWKSLAEPLEWLMPTSLDHTVLACLDCTRIWVVEEFAQAPFVDLDLALVLVATSPSCLHQKWFGPSEWMPHRNQQAGSPVGQHQPRQMQSSRCQMKTTYSLLG